jgi:hypothetical protein
MGRGPKPPKKPNPSTPRATAGAPHDPQACAETTGQPCRHTWVHAERARIHRAV